MATVSQAAGAGHALARDAVVVDADSQGVGVQWSENSADDALEETLDMIGHQRWPSQSRKPASTRTHPTLA